MGHPPDSGNYRVRRIDATSGIVTTVAGNGERAEPDEGVPATRTSIGAVQDIAFDPQGNLYLAGVNVYRLLKVSPLGILSTAGGNGSCGHKGDGGLATQASLCQPAVITADREGNLYVSDGTCHCVRRIAADTGIIQTVAGSGETGNSGDGALATAAQMQSVGSLAYFGETLYILDFLSEVVRSVTPPLPPPMPGIPAVSEVVHAASFVSGPVAPGQFVTIFGHYLGPPQPAFLTLGEDGAVTSQLEGTRVFFGSIPAPLAYVSAGQINAIVPYSVAGETSILIRLETPGGALTLDRVLVSPASPAVFPNAAVNEDGTINGPLNPAPRGTVLTLFGTGLGQTDPPGADGAITSAPLPKQVLPVAVLIDARTAELLYAGPAPSLVAGVFQLNVRIPLEVRTGRVELAFRTPASPNRFPIFVK